MIKKAKEAKAGYLVTKGIRPEDWTSIYMHSVFVL